MLLRGRKFQVLEKAASAPAGFAVQGVVWYPCLEGVLLLQLATLIFSAQAQGGWLTAGEGEHPAEHGHGLVLTVV